MEFDAALYNDAMALLARREHSRQQLLGKLTRRGYLQEQIVALLDQLEAEQLLSDDRFAESYARQRSQRGYGPQRIVAELVERGVDGGSIEEALERLGRDWYQLAIEVRIKRYGEVPPVDYKERSKQMRFLYYRGFDGDQIKAAIEN